MAAAGGSTRGPGGSGSSSRAAGGHPAGRPDGPAGPPSGYPGQRLGLPERGGRSVARPGRRVVGIVVDWLLCSLVAQALLGSGLWGPPVVLAVVHLVSITLLGGSPGHLLTGVRVVRLPSRWPGPGPALVRTVLLSLAVPALVFDVDQRGLHDRIAGTILLRR